MDDKLRSIVRRWLLPFILLIIIISGMTISFRSQSRKDAVTEITGDIQDQAKNCGVQLYTDLKQLRSFTLSYAEILKKEETIQADELEYIQLMKKYSKAYQVVLCERDGKGFDQTGASVDLSGTEYFGGMVEGVSDDFVFSKTDGITGAPAIITYTGIPKSNDNSKVLLVYYSPGFFADYINIFEYGSDAAFILMEEDGTIISEHGQKRYYEGSTKLWDKVDDTEENQAIIKRISQHTLTRKTSAQELTLNGEEVKAYYTPIGDLQWNVIILISKEDVTQLEERSWKGVNTLLISLILTMVLFVAAIIVLNILIKIRNTEHNQSLEIKIDMDMLTELNNKLATERKIKEYLMEHTQETGMLLVIDIDNFKKVNDTMGHAFGDEVLKTFGFLLRSEFRITDILGRTGGDEFMVFLKNIPDREFAEREAGRIEKTFTSFQSGEYVKYTATASIGVALFPQDGKEFSSLYKAADLALYDSKKKGKRQLSFYNGKQVT